MLHTADWQIGKQFAPIAGDAGAMLRTQRLETIKALAALASERRVDAVLVAGDVFEDNAVSDETLRRTMNALAGFQGAWVLLPGNHDAALAQSAWSRLRRLALVPDNVMLATDPESIELCDARLCVLPAPLQRRHEVRDLTDYFDAVETGPGVFRVGLAHGAVRNRLPEASEAMNLISDTRADSARLDYLALGDWHGTLEIASRTWYAGAPEPDRFKSNDPGNVLLVELTEPGVSPRVEKLRVGRFRWEQFEFAVADEASIGVLDGRIGSLADVANTLLRLRLSGALDLGARGQLDEVLERWRARLHHLGVDEAGLVARPSAEDIAAIGASGFMRDAIDTLSRIQDDPAHLDHAHAARALQLLYLEQLALRK
ncbi:MAG: DNA repair exonuclease [Pseudomonadota bacterium]|nr:DNA repair exonuclease [Pseudomonadota bacterium]